MKKVILISPSFLPKLNGITYATIGHIKILQALNYEVILITSKYNGIPVLKDYGLKGLILHQVDVSGSGLFWNRVRGSLDLIAEFIESSNPDFIFVEGWYNWAVLILLKIRVRSKIILFSHGSADNQIYSFSSFVRRIGYIYYDFIYKNNLFSRLDALILLSNFRDNRRFMDLDYSKKFRLKTFVLPNFNNQMLYSSPINYSKRITDGFRVALIGEICPNKNQLFILKILPYLVEKIKFDLFFPKENRYSKKISDSILNNSLQDRIFLHEGLNRNDINIYYKNNIDLLLIISRTEAQPIVLIDSLSHGIPFLATNVGCVSTFNGGICCPLNQIVENLNKFASNRSHYDFYKSRASVGLDVNNNEVKTFLMSL